MNIKKGIKIIILLLIILLVIVFFIKITNRNKKSREIHTIYQILLENNIQNNIKEESTLSVNVSEHKNIIGVVKINKIGFEGIIYEGTDMETLDKGVGHFENSPIFEGNVCLAAHNNKKFWAKLNKLKINDIIEYSCILGIKKYIVFNIQEIDSTDWSLLDDTDKNIITLITCIKNKPDKRLCVQAKEAI